MRDLAAVLRGELKSLEAELAQDPRVQKARKIRELLAMYGHPCPVPEPSHANALVDVISAAAGKNQRAKISRMRLVVQTFWPSKGTATLARSRLVEMSLTNRASDTRSAWLQLQTNPAGQKRSLEDVFPPESSISSPTPVSSRTPSTSPHSNRGGPTTTREEAEFDVGAAPVHERAADRGPEE